MNTKYCFARGTVFRRNENQDTLLGPEGTVAQRPTSGLFRFGEKLTRRLTSDEPLGPLSRRRSRKSPDRRLRTAQWTRASNNLLCG